MSSTKNITTKLSIPNINQSNLCMKSKNFNFSSKTKNPAVLKFNFKQEWSFCGSRFYLYLYPVC